MTTKRRKTSRELKEILLDEGEEVMRAVISAAKDGNNINPNHHPASQHKVWEALIPILQNTAEATKLKAKTNEEVLKLLALGTITVQEAKEMVSLLALINGEGDGPTENKIIIEIAKGGAT